MNKDQICEMVADIFSISRTEVYGLLKQGVGNNVAITKRGNNFKNPALWSHMLKKDLQRQIWTLHAQNKFFTLKDLHRYVKEELEWTGSKSTLLKIVKSMGYKFKKTDTRKILCERKHVVVAKIAFLEKYLRYLRSEDPVVFVYLDETWIYKNGTRQRQWVHDGDAKSNPKKIKQEGKRYTILHAGCVHGFLEGCDFLLDSDNNDRDYHKNMTAELFTKWTENQLLPALAKLDGKCVVVMDNAPYHSVRVNKPPTPSSNKNQMREWLVQHDITFNTNMTKKQLYELIIPTKEATKHYEIDELLLRHGHDVLRLPPYHCQYNPIEMMWGISKTYYNKHILSRPTDKDSVAKMWREALQQCTAETWQKSVRRCEQLIQDDWTKEMGDFDINNIPPFIIRLGDHSDSDTNDEETDMDITDPETDMDITDPATDMDMTNDENH